MTIIYALAWLFSMAVVWANVQSRGWILMICIVVSLLYVWYQARFLFARPLDRPLGYETASSVLFLLDLLAHLAAALACGTGMLGIASLALGYFMSGSTARAFAEGRVRSEVQDRFEQNTPDWTAEKRQGATALMAQRQIKGLGEGL